MIYKSLQYQQMQSAVMYFTPKWLLHVSACLGSMHSLTVHLTQTRYNIQFTGHYPMLIIMQSIFVEQETNWQADRQTDRQTD